MPTLEHDRLVFRFPQVDEEASFSIDFQRTLRIPDSDETYPLSPGLGSFPLRHAEDHAGKLSPETAKRGGVILPIWQAEAMWLNFRAAGSYFGSALPLAVKVAAGKINAVTGEPWRAGLHRPPQDYMVSPGQPWLDGFAIAPGVIRQFVAMPLGEGYTAEAQLTGEEVWGGLQIEVTPLKAGIWQELRRRREAEMRTRERRFAESAMPMAAAAPAPASMGLAAGGRMRQAIYPDRFALEDWDSAAADRVFVSLLHAKDWKLVTGEDAPNHPPTAGEYARAGLPWFDYYGADQTALPGGALLASLRSLAKLHKQKTGAVLPNSQDVKVGMVKPLGPGAGPRTVRSSELW